MATSVPGLLAKKSEGKELSDEEIKVFITKVVNKDIHESQIGAMLMAIYLKGLSRRETVVLTKEMVNSGASLSWPAEWKGLLVDKHSTGGVGDKISLVLAPALAAINLKVPMISGRGLAHTGGTLDKLEAIPGYRVQLSQEEMHHQLETVGCFIAGQTDNVCPADKKLYALRDVTSTVSHVGLITASIVSKKAAESIDCLILDVKTGKGAFMSEKERAVELARSMVDCSNDLGIKTAALITDMNSPIGNMVGNALEVIESIHCLQDMGPTDLSDLVAEIGGHVLSINGVTSNAQDGCSRIREVLANGQALSKFCSMMKGQGVDSQLADDLCNRGKDPHTLLPRAAKKQELKCSGPGYVHAIDAMTVAKVCHKLGGGRNVPGEAINWAVGLELLVGIGDKVTEGQDWIRVHYDDEGSFTEVSKVLEEAITISNTPIAKRSRVIEVVS